MGCYLTERQNLEVFRSMAVDLKESNTGTGNLVSDGAAVTWGQVIRMIDVRLRELDEEENND
jgi:hypothetical protein